MHVGSSLAIPGLNGTTSISDFSGVYEMVKLTRVSIHSWCPLDDAQCKAVNPSLSMQATEAPAFTKVMMASVLPGTVHKGLFINYEKKFREFSKPLSSSILPLPH